MHKINKHLFFIMLLQSLFVFSIFFFLCCKIRDMRRQDVCASLKFLKNKKICICNLNGIEEYFVVKELFFLCVQNSSLLPNYSPVRFHFAIEFLRFMIFVKILDISYLLSLTKFFGYSIYFFTNHSEFGIKIKR